MPINDTDDLRARALRCLPGGVNSNVRLRMPPRFFIRGEGAWLWDSERRDYVDYVLGQGPNFLGHAPRQVLLAVEDACKSGMIYGGQHALEVEAAERLLSVVGWPDLVRFGLTGTEMVQAALRLARAVTRRRKFVRFEGHYHGWLDNVLVALTEGKPGPGSAGQISEYLDDSFVARWNDDAHIADLLSIHGDEIAAVIMEPVMLNSGAIEPRTGYLELVRSLCDTYGIVLIFDEVITGFRVAPGGASQRYSVVPDLAIYGKAMAGGWPVAALAGRGDIMERLGTGEVNHSGTFNGSIMACAATIATLDVLATGEPYNNVAAHGEELMKSLRLLGDEHGMPLRVQGLPMVFHASFGQGAVNEYRDLTKLDSERYAVLARRLADVGVWVATGGRWYVSAVHGEHELSVVMERVHRALGQMAL